MYTRPYAHRSRLFDYIMPFLIIICVGVIFVMIYNLWKSVFTPSVSADAYLHIESGSVQVKTWGAEKFLNLTSDALIMEGDEVKTSAEAKVIVEFFDGTIMRLDGGTDIVLKDFNNDTDNYSVNLVFVNGKVWINKLYKNTSATKIVTNLANINVTSSMGSVYEMEFGTDEEVRVLQGEGDDNEVLVDVLTIDSKVVETEKIRVGQEAVFTDAVLEKYRQYQSPSLITAFSDSFRQSQWYLWNTEQDKNPAQFSKSAILGQKEGLTSVSPETVTPETAVAPDTVTPETTSTTTTTATTTTSTDTVAPAATQPVADLTPPSTPTLVSVNGVTKPNADGFFEVDSILATITGSVSKASQVTVNGYTLKKFKAGDTTWTYFANANFALMKSGENTYEVYAVSANGAKSAPLTVKVLYTPTIQKPATQPEVTPPATEVPQDPGVGAGI